MRGRRRVGRTLSHASRAAPPESFDLARLRLRRPRVSDADAVFAYGSDPEVARFMDWPVCTSVDPVVDSLRRRAERWTSGAEYAWVITLPTEDRAFGGVSCSVDRHAAEFGFVLGRQHWGRGFATEVARAIVEWALTEPSIWRVWATCDVENVASARVLEKAGLSREGLLRRAVVRPNLSPEPRDAYLYAKVRG